MRRFLFLSSFWLLVLVGVMAVTRRQEPLPQWIYFERNSQLHRVSWDGSQREALPITGALEHGLSPDARWAFTWDAVEDTFMLRSTNSLEEHTIPDTFISDYMWSPDSQYFVINTSDRLRRYEVATGTWQRIIVPADVNALIDWSSDGKWLLLSGVRGEFTGRETIFSVHLYTKGLHEYGNIWNPLFSPDGEWIAFSDLSNGDVFKMRVDGSDLQNLTDSAGHASRFLMWDEDWLYFYSGTEVMRMRSDGSDLQPYEQLSFYPLPVRYRDWLVYTDHEIIGDMALTQVFRHNHTTSETVQLTNGPADSFPRIIPPADLKWHPTVLALSAFLLFAAAALIRHFQRQPRAGLVALCV